MRDHLNRVIKQSTSEKLKSLSQEYKEEIERQSLLLDYYNNKEHCTDEDCVKRLTIANNLSNMKFYLEHPKEMEALCSSQPSEKNVTHDVIEGDCGRLRPQELEYALDAIIPVLLEQKAIIVSVGTRYGEIERRLQHAGLEVRCNDLLPPKRNETKHWDLIHYKEASFPGDNAKVLPKDCSNVVLLSAYPQGFLGELLVQYMDSNGKQLMVVVEDELESDMHAGLEPDGSILSDTDHETLLMQKVDQLLKPPTHDSAKINVGGRSILRSKLGISTERRPTNLVIYGEWPRPLFDEVNRRASIPALPEVRDPEPDEIERLVKMSYGSFKKSSSPLDIIYNCSIGLIDFITTEAFEIYLFDPKGLENPTQRWYSICEFIDNVNNDIEQLQSAADNGTLTKLLQSQEQSSNYPPDRLFQPAAGESAKQPSTLLVKNTL